MCVCVCVVRFSMSEGHTVTEATTHKEEKPSRIRSDEEDSEKIREKLQSCIDPLYIYPRWRGSVGAFLSQPKDTTASHLRFQPKNHYDEYRLH